MKWIKASERLPENSDKKLHIRINGVGWGDGITEGVAIYRSNHFVEKKLGSIDNRSVEWLEEPSPILYTESDMENAWRDYGTYPTFNAWLTQYHKQK